MIRLLLFIASFFISCVLNAQQNLVINPSFEDYTICPDETSQILYANGWKDANTGTCDYYNACYTTGPVNVDVPNNFIGYQNGKSGLSYAGIVVYLYSPTPFHYREYLQINLSTPLLAGVKYYVSFNISHADSSYYVSDDIGIYFSTSEFNQMDFLNINVNPQISNAEGNFISENAQWIRINGTFIALGGEDHLIIGNFKDDFDTDTIKINNGLEADYLSAYYFIDDVCVSTDSLFCTLPMKISEQSLTNNFQINQSEHIVFITSTSEERFDVCLFDVSGRKISETKGVQQTVHLDLTDLNAGLYIVSISFSNQTYSRKIYLNP